MPKEKTLEGIIKITSKPIGFVEIEGQEEDPVVFEEDLNCALNRDKVEIEIIGKEKGRNGRPDKPKARVLKVLERSKTKFVGTIEKFGAGLVLIVDDFKF